MRKFEPKSVAEFAREHEGERFEVYFKYLGDYIIKYFKELSEEIRKEAGLE